MAKAKYDYYFHIIDYDTCEVLFEGNHIRNRSASDREVKAGYKSLREELVAHLQHHGFNGKVIVSVYNESSSMILPTYFFDNYSDMKDSEYWQIIWSATPMIPSELNMNRNGQLVKDGKWMPNSVTFARYGNREKRERYTKKGIDITRYIEEYKNRNMYSETDNLTLEDHDLIMISRHL